MCRIYGHFSNYPDNRIPRTLECSSAMQFEGGPDQQSIMFADDWGIGANRLAIQGLHSTELQYKRVSYNDAAENNITGGQQPYCLNGEVYAVFNGEIYNHKELRRSLLQKGYHFKDECDGSILPALYAEYGEEFVEHLDGMFAFAIVDVRENPKLFAAVDHMGIKPFYYSWNEKERSLSFASEIPGLVVIPNVKTSIREQAVDECLTMRIPLGNQTVYENINSLQPGNMLTLEQGKAPVIRSYNRAFHLEDEFGANSHQTSHEAFRELFDQEVGKILEAEFPISLIASGGIDSSLIVALAAQRKPDLHTFHVCSKGDWPSDERQYARDLVRHCGIEKNYHEVEVDLDKEFPNVVSGFAKSLGQPDTAHQSFGAYALAGTIRDFGFKVAVGGEGADELFGGYDRYRRAITDPQGQWLSNYINELSPFDQDLKWSLYSKDYQNLLGGKQASFNKVRKLFGDVPANLSAEERLKMVLEFDQQYRLPAHLLRRADHIMMANSIEMRVPFCQARIREFASRLSVQEKINGGRSKCAVYDAGKGIVPTSILERKKQHFILPITAMYRSNQTVRQFMRDVITSGDAIQNPYFDKNSIKEILDKPPEDIGNQQALALWSLMTYDMTTSHVMRIALDKTYRNDYAVGYGDTASRQEVSVLNAEESLCL